MHERVGQKIRSRRCCIGTNGETVLRFRIVDPRREVVNEERRPANSPDAFMKIDSTFDIEFKASQRATMDNDMKISIVGGGPGWTPIPSVDPVGIPIGKISVFERNLA